MMYVLVHLFEISVPPRKAANKEYKSQRDATSAKRECTVLCGQGSRRTRNSHVMVRVLMTLDRLDVWRGGMGLGEKERSLNEVH